ncbi:MAG: hypothetical protein ABSH03_06860 [Candidatus Lustribacter sp.]|jgi:hypothetical protein
MIVASAGRRIDPPNADPEHFPERRIPVVRERIRTALQESGARTLVCSAACGADLIALDVAGELGIDRRIIIPAPLEEFRAHSVVDRPGDWGSLFDRLVSGAGEAGRLELVDLPERGAQAYLKVNAAILDRAAALASESGDVLGVFAIWDGPLVGRTDYTLDFVEAAKGRGIPVREIGIV